MAQPRRISISAILSLVLSFPASLPLSQQVALTAGASIVITQTACGEGNDLERLNDALNKVAKSLEAAIDTNGRLYATGIYGVVGSPEAIAMRQRVAKVVGDSNEYLIQALTITKGLTKATFEGSKIAIIEKLSLAAIGLKIGHQTVDLVLQTVTAFINTAMGIVQLFQANDVRYIRLAIPKINGHIKAFEHLREINVVPEVFAE
jgi:hypothetical protein